MLYKVYHFYTDFTAGQTRSGYEIVLADSKEEALTKYNNLAEQRKSYPYGWEKAKIGDVKVLKDIIQ